MLKKRQTRKRGNKEERQAMAMGSWKMLGQGKPRECCIHPHSTVLHRAGWGEGRHRACLSVYRAAMGQRPLLASLGWGQPALEEGQAQGARQGSETAAADTETSPSQTLSRPDGRRQSQPCPDVMSPISVCSSAEWDSHSACLACATMGVWGSFCNPPHEESQAPVTC